MHRYGTYKIFTNYVLYKIDFTNIQKVLSKTRMEMSEEEFIAVVWLLGDTWTTCNSL